MAGPHGLPPLHVPPPFKTELAKRIISALVLAPIALLGAWLGGAVWMIGCGVVALVILWEWNHVTRADGMDRAFYLAAIILIATTIVLMVLRLGPVPWLAVLLVVPFLAAGVLHATRGSDDTRAWLAAGTLYVLAFLIPVVLLRTSTTHGIEVIVFLFAVVWATDVCAFFAGRAIGGPKLWPAISPKKTWSGFIGGTIGGALLAYVAMRVLGVPTSAVLIGVAILLSIVSHIGDLYESWVKRVFHHKDSSQLIPGHGGVMDRLDGFIFAAALACVIGLARGGLEDPAGGLLRW